MSKEASEIKQNTLLHPLVRPETYDFCSGMGKWTACKLLKPDGSCKGLGFLRQEERAIRGRCEFAVIDEKRVWLIRGRGPVSLATMMEEKYGPDTTKLNFNGSEDSRL